MKTFKQFTEDAPTMSTGADIPGTTAKDPANWKNPKKKKKYKILTRNFIELPGGIRKRLYK